MVTDIPAGSVRAARAADLDALLALESRFPGDRLTRRSFQRFIASSTAAVLVYCVDTVVVGNIIVLARKNSTSARIYSLIVDAAWQRRGIARALVGTAVRMAIAHGHVSIGLELRTDNVQAQQLYCGLGFQAVTQRASFYDDGCSAVCMRKALRD